jgi:hypothetical protein
LQLQLGEVQLLHPKLLPSNKLDRFNQPRLSKLQGKKSLKTISEIMCIKQTIKMKILQIKNFIKALQRLII